MAATGTSTTSGPNQPLERTSATTRTTVITATATVADRRPSARSAAHASGTAHHTYAGVSDGEARKTRPLQSGSGDGPQARRPRGPSRSSSASPPAYTSASSALTLTMYQHSE